MSYALGSDLKSFQAESNKHYSFDYSWGSMMVFPLYGVARRFGKVSVFVQGVGLIALQAGVRLSLHPLGPIASHG